MKTDINDAITAANEHFRLVIHHHALAVEWLLNQYTVSQEEKEAARADAFKWASEMWSTMPPETLESILNANLKANLKAVKTPPEES